MANNFNWRELNWDTGILGDMISEEDGQVFYKRTEKHGKLLKQILDNLDILSPRERQVIDLLYLVGEHSISMAPKVLELSEYAIRTYAKRGKQKLIKKLNVDEDS